MTCSPDVPGAVNLGGRLERMSTAGRLALGFGPGELLGRPFANLLHPADRAAVAARLNQDIYAHHIDLQQFTYMIFHNLRAPLGNALGLATMLTKPGKNTDNFDQTLGHLRQRMSQADAVSTDLNQVLAIRDRPALPEPAGLAEVCAQVLASRARARTECGGQVRLDVAPGLAGRGTRAYLYSIFDNLLTNAIKYRAQGRPLAMRLRAVADGRGGVTTTVAGNGGGVDAQLAGAKVFQLYQRFHGTPPGRGMGGLFLVKPHVEALPGHLSVASTVGEGTVFSLSLPAA